MSHDNTDHELLIMMSSDIGHIKETVEQLAKGDTANCATERARTSEVEKQIEKLWKTRASAISLNLLWSIVILAIGGLIAYAAK